MRLLSLLLVLSIATHLDAQRSNSSEKWLGVNNLFFKNKEVISDPAFLPGDSIRTYNEVVDYQFSFGVSFRKVKDDGIRYQQFDLFAIDQSTQKSLTIISRPIDSVVEPAAGSQEVKNLNISVGYQRGKILSIAGNLSGDVGIKGYFWYQKNQLTPLTVSGFPSNVNILGSGFSLKTGLIYRIHERLNIGYYISPLSIEYSWRKNYVENPILTEQQKTSQGYDFDIFAFPSAFNFRNFHINYIF